MIFSNKYIELVTERFDLRILRPGDASSRYLSWFTEKDVLKHIYAAKSEQTIESLNQFIAEKYESSNCLFFGIFTKKSNLHIGNVKFEPIDSNANSSVMGIMLGDTDWRGKGVAGEVIQACYNYLKDEFDLQSMQLGVEVDNHAAIRAYEKLGFKVIESSVIIEKQVNALIMEKIK